MLGLREVEIQTLNRVTAKKRAVTERLGTAAVARKLKRKRWVYSS